MTCEDIADLIEPLASGDVVPDADFDLHVSSCPICSGALGRARQIERALDALQPWAPPVAFADRVMARVRSERLRAERYVDAGFNVAIASGILLVLAGVWGLLSLTGVAEITADLSTVVGEGLRLAASQASAGAPAFLGAVGLLISALVLWGWADRRWDF